MEWFIFTGPGRRRELVWWTPEARTLFMEIVRELSDIPGVRAAPKMRLPTITRNRTFVVFGYEDGIAIRFDEQHQSAALEIRGCRLLGRGDRPRVLRGLVAVPWSANERWRDLARTAVMAAG